MDVSCTAVTARTVCRVLRECPRLRELNAKDCRAMTEAELWATVSEFWPAKEEATGEGFAATGPGMYLSLIHI